MDYLLLEKCNHQIQSEKKLLEIGEMIIVTAFDSFLGILTICIILGKILANVLIVLWIF